MNVSIATHTRAEYEPVYSIDPHKHPIAAGYKSFVKVASSGKGPSAILKTARTGLNVVAEALSFHPATERHAADIKKVTAPLALAGRVYSTVGLLTDFEGLFKVEEDANKNVRVLADSEKILTAAADTISVINIGAKDFKLYDLGQMGRILPTVASVLDSGATALDLVNNWSQATENFKKLHESQESEAVSADVLQNEARLKKAGTDNVLGIVKDTGSLTSFILEIVSLFYVNKIISLVSTSISFVTATIGLSKVWVKESEVPKFLLQPPETMFLLDNV